MNSRDSCTVCCRFLWLADILVPCPALVRCQSSRRSTSGLSTRCRGFILVCFMCLGIFESPAWVVKPSIESHTYNDFRFLQASKFWTDNIVGRQKAANHVQAVQGLHSKPPGAAILSFLMKIEVAFLLFCMSKWCSRILKTLHGRVLEGLSQPHSRTCSCCVMPIGDICV